MDKICKMYTMYNWQTVEEEEKSTHVSDWESRQGSKNPPTHLKNLWEWKFFGDNQMVNMQQGCIPIFGCYHVNLNTSYLQELPSQITDFRF